MQKPSSSITCYHTNCNNIAKYPAKKHLVQSFYKLANNLKLEILPDIQATITENSKFIYFCLEHIRLFNKEFDFFAGKSDSFIDNFQKDALYHERKTNKFGVGNINSYQQQIEQKVNNFRHFKANKIITNNYSKEQKKAMQMLDLEQGFNKEQLRINYKKLAKIHHPDLSKEKNSHKKIASINEAYRILIQLFA